MRVAATSTIYAGVRDTSSVTDPRLTPVAFDVTDPGGVAEAARELTDVTLVVNNAGIARPATALSATLADARAEIEINYLGRPRRFCSGVAGTVEQERQALGWQPRRRDPAGGILPSGGSRFTWGSAARTRANASASRAVAASQGW